MASSPMWMRLVRSAAQVSGSRAEPLLCHVRRRREQVAGRGGLGEHPATQDEGVPHFGGRVCPEETRNRDQKIINATHSWEVLERRVFLAAFIDDSTSPGNETKLREDSFRTNTDPAQKARAEGLHGVVGGVPSLGRRTPGLRGHGGGAREGSKPGPLFVNYWEAGVVEKNNRIGSLFREGCGNLNPNRANRNVTRW